MLQELVTNQLWVEQMPLKIFGVNLGTRMTVIRLSEGGLWVHSPIKLTPAVRRALDSLGPVRAVISPNEFHHLFVTDYFLAFPQAQIYASPGLPNKRKDLHFHGILGEAPESLWKDDLDQLLFQGMEMMKEAVFYHRATRTLILTDLCFYFTEKSAPGTSLPARLLGVYNQLGPSRLGRFLTKDKPAARLSLQKMLEWDFERVIVAHSEILETGGKPAIEKAFRWLK